ncbi:hypothetical protein [Nocardia arthritidis]|uniref:Uncharacterized protein n=1 Tax=Nocardia arthritidis TaxID=228602 RepID=A0A6G9YBQ3_9NOCA|nr:hypothetical protein [Nocardia arthritidis]QIS10584.1 hypothetical protein F5544_13475 [Nocardia arthritidis]
MVIRVRRELRGKLHSDQTVLFVVRSPDAERLAAGMAAARAAVYEMDGPSYVSEPIPIPDGRLVMVDFGDVPPQLRLELPEVVSAALTSAGIEDASIEPAPRMGERFAALNRFMPVTRAWLRGLDPPGRPRVLARPPESLISAGRQWLRDEYQDGDELLTLAISAEIPLIWDQFTPIVGALLGSRAPLPHPTPVLTTDFRTRAASAEFGTLFGFGVLLTAGGANWSTADLAPRMLRQRDLIRANTEHLAWAAIGIDPLDRDLLIPQTQATEIADPATAAWYRLFSPEQLDALGGPPPGAVELPGGRVESTVGEPGASA